MHLQYQKQEESSKGITLLYAIVVVAVLAIIVSSASVLVTRSVQFAFSDRESNEAFYAAESGAECALFWDVDRLAFGRDGTHMSAADMQCHESVLSDITSQNVTDSDLGSVVEFLFSVDLGPAGCSDVSVRKTRTGDYITKIEARGYNTCVSGAPNRVERGFRIVYRES